MLVQGSRVAIVGGSIAGCTTSIALTKLGLDCTIFERSRTSDLRDRGLGIGLPKSTQQALLEKGYILPDYKFVQTKVRHWFVRDGVDKPLGRKIWEQRVPVQLHNWGLLYHQLRQQVHSDKYKSRISVGSIDFGDDGVELFSDSSESLGMFDFVVAADGPSSSMRATLMRDDEKKPEYSGYVLVRGSVPLETFKDLPEHDYFLTEECWTTFGYSGHGGGHGVCYAIPKSDGSDGYLVNWAVYTKTPPGMSIDSPAVIRNVSDECSKYWYELVETEMAPYFGAICKACDISFHPIFDQSPDHLVHPSNRMLLVGDAGAILRPHTASGTSKAVQDVFLLQELCSKPGATWNEVCCEFQMQRKKFADNMVQLGKRLGHAQVINTPDWANMKPEDFQAWTEAQVKGADYYIAKED